MPYLCTLKDIKEYKIGLKGMNLLIIGTSMERNMKFENIKNLIIGTE